jgi:hypothetical protein
LVVGRWRNNRLSRGMVRVVIANSSKKMNANMELKNERQHGVKS